MESLTRPSNLACGRHCYGETQALRGELVQDHTSLEAVEVGFEFEQSGTHTLIKYTTVLSRAGARSQTWLFKLKFNKIGNSALQLLTQSHFKYSLAPRGTGCCISTFRTWNKHHRKSCCQVLLHSLFLL